jgi:DNA-binding NtrC family response regulator
VAAKLGKPSETQRSIDTVALGGLRPGVDAERGSATLLIYHRDGVRAAPLTEGRPVVIGRGRTADIPIRERSLSRHHARVQLRDGQAWIEDLQSTNGTKLNGEPIQCSQLAVGDVATLGTVCVSLARGDQTGLDWLEGHDRFITRVEEEVARQRTFGRQFALLMIQAVRGNDNAIAQWCPAIRKQLRPVDKMALYSPTAVEVLLPEANEDEAHTIAEQVIQSVDNKVASLFCGIGVFPRAATAAEELIYVTRDAARRADSNGPIAAASSGLRALSPVTTASEDRDSLMIVRSPAMEGVYQLIERVARSSIPVLISGETGVGKEVVAQAIHALSKRREYPLRSMNCGAIPQQLIESALFGHERGAFTGAERQAKGIFEQASGGMVFLDEVGELPMAAQVALLRVLETKQITRVGGAKEMEVDVRILAATNRDLQAMCDAGTFRIDLLYRLNAMTIEVPPLRERVEEIEPLAQLFLAKANVANETILGGIEASASELLRGYSWPGNVRELRNVIERASVIAQEGMVTPDDLPQKLRTTQPPAASAMPTGGIDEISDFKGMMQRYEAEVIVEALRCEGWNQTRAARRLDMPLRTFAHKMKVHGIRKKLGYELEDGEQEPAS